MSHGMKRLTFAQWQQQLDTLIALRAGLRTKDLPHLEIQSAFEAGESPPEYFADVVLPELDDLGFSIDALEDVAGPKDPEHELRAAYLAATGDFF